MTYEIAGARCRGAKPREAVERAQSWAAARGATVLLADAAVVFGRDHLESAVRHALRAQAAGRRVARDLGLETLRYLCGRRQVSEAIREGGLQPTTEAAAIVVFESSADDLVAHLTWLRDDGVLSPDGKSLGILGITAREVETVTRERAADLALERTALLDTEK